MSITALPAKPAPCPQARFDELRLQAAALLREAALIPALPLLHVRQAEASANIAGIKLHRVHGQGNSDDALAIRADIEALARTVDPLIAAIGDELGNEFHGVDRSLFADVVFGAVDGNATFECEEAARRADEDQAEFAADRKGWARAAAMGVD